MTSMVALVEQYRANRRLLLLIVYVALFLDNMLLTTVVPIIPEYLLRIQHPNATDILLHNRIATPPPATAATMDTALKVRRRGTRQAAKKQQAASQPVGWDSIDWEDESWGKADGSSTRTRMRVSQQGGGGRPISPSRKEPAKNKGMRPSSSGGGSRMMKPAALPTTTPFSSSSAGDDDSYESLPEEFSIDGYSGKPLEVAKPPPRPDSRFYAEQERMRHQTLAEENVHVGLMFGSKALIQLIVNPFIGPLTNKIGYTMPMFAGFGIMFLSTLLFAFGSTYSTLWMARALQGVGSACTSTSGMGMLAQAYPDDAERGSAMGIALGGLALGVLVGPPYGGLLYQWAGKELPFILLALLALGDGTLQFLVLQPRIDRGEPEGTAIKELARDPYIMVAAGSITIGNLGIAMLEPSLPLWMMESWSAGSFERGAAFLPASISYLIGTNIFGPLAHKIGRWLSGFIGLVVIGFCLIAIPSAGSIGGLVIPNFFMGFSIGMIDASMFPMMGYIVDVRHVGVYGSIYAIADAAFCFAFALGPFFSGPLVRSLGFPTMMYLIAVINFCYAPLMFFLRHLPESPPAPPTTTLSGGITVGYQSHLHSRWRWRWRWRWRRRRTDGLGSGGEGGKNRVRHHRGEPGSRREAQRLWGLYCLRCCWWGRHKAGRRERGADRRREEKQSLLMLTLAMPGDAS